MKTLNNEATYPRGYRTIADVFALLSHFLKSIDKYDR